MKLCVKANRSPWSGNIEMLIAAVDSRGDTNWFADPLTMRERPTGEIITPTITLDTTAAQELMDNLWYCGLRPSEGTGSAGSLKATQDHLADMRKIAFTYIKE